MKKRCSIKERQDLAEVLKDLRKKKGLSQMEFAKCIGVKQSVVGRIESPNGKRLIRIDTLREYLLCLGYELEFKITKIRQ